MNSEIQVRIYSPDKAPVESTVGHVVLWASDGFVEIHPDHAPITFLLGNGRCSLHGENGVHHYGLFGGVAHLKENRLLVLSYDVEHQTEVDLGVVGAKEGLSNVK